MPTDDAHPPISVRGYTRTRHPRSITFPCQGCNTIVTEQRAPGPPPRYCEHCSADPDLVRHRARQRKAAQRRRQGLDTSTSDDVTPEHSLPHASSNVTGLASAVTELSAVAEFATGCAAEHPGQEELVVSVVVPGQQGIAHVTASGLQSLPVTPASDRVPPDSTPAAATIPEAASSKSTPRPAKQSRPAPRPLVVHVRNGHTHWLADDARTYCGRRISARASVTQRGWASCTTCEQRRTRGDSSDATHTSAMQRKLTTADAAARLGMTSERLTALARDGVLGQKVGRSWIFTTKELDAYKRRRKAHPRRQPATVRGVSTTRRSRVSRADLHAAHVLDLLLAQEREVEQRYDLPFRAPARVATTIHDCHRCGRAMVFLIFGDNAQDEAGLLAYARLMEQPIQEQRLHTYVLAPSAASTVHDDAPSLLLQVWPEIGRVETITPLEWEQLIADLSRMHCP
jgi:hypothetical protein